MLFNYDRTSEESIYEYAKKLEKMTFREIMEEYNKSVVKHYVNPSERGIYDIRDEVLNVAEEETGYYTNENAKGQLGGLIEKYYFGYQPNGDQSADFSETGIELKQTCVDKKKDGSLRAGERLVITMLSFKDPVVDDFYDSHVWDKIKKILLVQYLRDKSKDRLDYQIQFVNMFTPPKEDLAIIIDDYNIINQKIKDGKAHELSESDTMYLGACTKGQNSITSNQPQYYGNHELARRRAYCFKQSYMNFILNNYVLKNDVPYESIIKDKDILKEKSFEDILVDKIKQYVGKSDKELLQTFDVNAKSKGAYSTLALRMLGVKSNRAEEFEKANIVVKAIRVEQNGKIKEHMSFPTFKVKELISEESWEESNLYDYFSSTKFLFVIFKNDGKYYRLKNVQLWNMSNYDLETYVQECWNRTRKVINEGIKFVHSSRGIMNNLPKKTENPVMHVRPHAQRSAFKLYDGTNIGKESDMDELPDGQWMTKQCFWLNNDYIFNQLK